MTIRLEDVSRKTLKIKALPVFPSRAVGGDGVTITKANGIYTVSVTSGTYAALSSNNTYTGTQTFNGTVTLGGSTAPQMVFAPTSGATKQTQLYQSGNLFNIADNNVNVRVSIDIANGSANFLTGTAIPAGGTLGGGVTLFSTPYFGIFAGSGVPTLSAAKGSLYLRSDGSTTNDRAYINTNGGTTWTALTTAG